MRTRPATCLCAALALLVPLPAHGALSETDRGLPVSQLLSRGDLLLSNGQGAAALDYYDEAIERSPDDYLSRFKRATARSSLGASRKALEDLESVLRITEFGQARIQSARLHLKLGEFDEAKAAVKAYVGANAADEASKTLTTNIAAAAAQAAQAAKASSKQQWENCILAATNALEHAPHSLALRELRAECHIGAGPSHLDDAIADLNRAVTLSPSSHTLLLRLSLLSYLYGGQDAAQGMAGIKQCLHYDPESKPCKAAFRSLRAIEKDVARVRNFMDASSWTQAIAILDKPATGLLARVRDALVAHEADARLGGDAVVPSQLLTTVLGWTCRAYVRKGNSPQLALRHCNELLKRDPDNVDALTARGDDALRREEYEEAVRVLSDAFEKSGRSDREVLGRLQKAQKLLKQSKSKDYYKVLGVARDADDRTIKRAYRKATLTAHPDKEGGSETKMAALNEAYEVLSNPELRQRFDNGDDPMDPQAGQGGQGHPIFHQGGHPIFQQAFGGGFQGFQGFGGGGAQHAAMTDTNGQHARRRSPGRSPYARPTRRPRSAASTSSSSISPSSFVLAPSSPSPIPGPSSPFNNARYHSVIPMDVSPAGSAAPCARAAPVAVRPAPAPAAPAPMVTLYSTSPAPATPGARSAIVSDPVHPNSLVPRRLHSQELCDFIKARPTADLFHHLAAKTSEVIVCSPGPSSGQFSPPSTPAEDDCDMMVVDDAAAAAPVQVAASSAVGVPSIPPLADYIRAIVVASNVMIPTLMCTLVFLERLKSKLPAVAKGMPCTRHRIFLAALITSAKYLNDSSPKNKHWARYAGIFSVPEVNLMELLHLISFDLRISQADLDRNWAPWIGKKEAPVRARPRPSALNLALPPSAPGVSSLRQPAASGAITPVHWAFPGIGGAPATPTSLTSRVPMLTPSSASSSASSTGPCTPETPAGDPALRTVPRARTPVGGVSTNLSPAPILGPVPTRMRTVGGSRIAKATRVPSGIAHARVGGVDLSMSSAEPASA